jgi:hypothetical protein
MSDATSTVTNYDVSKMDSAKMANLGQWVKETFAQYEKDRKGVEEQWLRNLRQFRGIYDPDIANRIPDDQSTAYPKITRNKVIGTVARLMEMLFPPRGTDKNFEVACSPLPDLQQADLQTVLDTLSHEANGADLTDEVIERGIRAFAAERAKRLEKEVEDQLAELDYVRLAKRIVFSAVLYSVGIMKGPMIVQEEGRTWSKAPDGKYVAQTVQKKRPYFENVSNWDWFTDLSAKTIDATDADCQRHIMNRTELRELADRKDFLGDAIREYLRTHTTGNYKQRWWETELRAKSADKSNVSDLTGRKYEAIEFWGRINGHQLAACGVAVPDNQLEDEVEANLWVIDNVVIKATMNPYDGRIRGYHTFIYEEDDINLLGNGLPVVMRDSQLAICEAARMILDNGSVVCGPMVEANISLLMPGSDTDIYARKVWLREDTGPDAGVPAVRSIEVQSHINELIQIIELFQGFADSETALPPPALGDVSGQGKESMRTTGNLSMLMGAAALPIRDTVRNFDKFTVSFISSLCYWNLEFNPNPNIKGDFKVLARGSTSLIAKEVRATALDQFWLTLDPEDKMYFDRTKILKERMRVRDLPDDMLDTDENIRAKLKEQADSSAATAQQQGDLMRAQIRGEVAAAFKDLMLGLKAQAAGNADVFNTITERIIDVRNSANDALAASKAGGSGTSSPPARAPERAGVAGAG